MSHSDRYVLANWPAPRHVVAFTTTRLGGYSQEPYETNNLALHVNDNEQHVQLNRQQLRQDWHLDKDITWLDQVHGNTVLNLDSPVMTSSADAVMTTQKHRPCVVLTADCLPVLICNNNGSEVAAIHAGWRGLQSGIIAATIKRLQSQPHTLMAWFGPAIGQSHLKLNKCIRQQFIEQDSEYAPAFENVNNEPHLDLFHLARIQLSKVGVEATYGGNHCTYSDSSKFYSYRTNRTTGRMASMIFINPAPLV